MPNHCNNVLTITVEPSKKEWLSELIESAKEGRMYDFILPMPECLNDVIAGSYAAGTDGQKELEERYAANIAECGYSNWYNWCLAHWGTKWDIYDHDVIEEQPTLFKIVFNSAWSPPMGVLEALSEMDGVNVYCTYFEPGMAFCGHFNNGTDVCYDIEQFTTEWVSRNIPFSIADEMGLFEYAAEIEEYEEEEEVE
jgi:hypothetical protein